MAFRTSESFLGRQNFVAHLSAELRRQALGVSEGSIFRPGGTIWSEIVVAIENSEISIIVFSENCSISDWCLEDVVLVLEQRKAKGQIVIPVFYRTSETVVEQPRWGYADLFSKYERENPHKAKEWMAVLLKAMNIGPEGHVMSSVEEGNRSEAKAIDDIVREVKVKLNQISSVEFSGLAGIKSQIPKVRFLLDAAGAAGLICIICIWGMVGIGKSKLGEYVYNQVCDQYEYFCLLSDYNKDQLQKELLFMRSKGYKKVLIFLDGVKKPEQVETLAELFDEFGVGSRIIVTTRNRGVFRGFDCNKFEIRTYEVGPLSCPDVHRLLIKVLFDGNDPPEDYRDLLNRVVDYTGGNPKVLELLAKHLYDKTKEQRESALEKLKRIQLGEIHDLLVSSYNEIVDDKIQTLFIDIAYVFEGETREHVTDVLNACDLDVTNGITTLVEWGLIYLRDGRLCLNSLHEGMAREIVRRESPKRTAIRSRIVNHDEFLRLLASDTGKGAVRSLRLDLANIRDLQLSPDSFSGMLNLKFLIFCHYGLPGDCGHHANVLAEEGVISLPDELRLLHGQGYPLNPENLLECQLPPGLLELLQEGTMGLKYLKLIKLCHCQKLRKLSELQG